MSRTAGRAISSFSWQESDAHVVNGRDKLHAANLTHSLGRGHAQPRRRKPWRARTTRTVMPSRKDKLIGANLSETINQLRESWKHLHIHHGGDRKLTMSTVRIHLRAIHRGRPHSGGRPISEVAWISYSKSVLYSDKGKIYRMSSRDDP